MKVSYAPCDCIEPEWYDDERAAVYKFAEAEHKLANGGGQCFWAIHVKGKGHIVNVILP